MSVLGWDIGGVNTKVARVDAGRLVSVHSRAFELQRAPGALVAVLRELASRTGTAADPAGRLRCAVTMTAELSQMFLTKRDGVTFVLDAVEAAFPSAEIGVYAADGRFLAPDDARGEPLAVAAANWAATARLVAEHHRDALLVDVGTTTTDIIPVVGGVIAAQGWTDPARLASGELVYTGAVRTAAEAIASEVPLGKARARVSAEAFALSGDVHVWRGDLDPARYEAPTPDGRPPTRAFAGVRLARVVCADRDMLDEEAISRIADALAAAQVDRIRSAIEQVIARHPSIRTAVVTGLGAFVGEAAARAAGLSVTPLSSRLGEPAARCAPAAAVALLFDRMRPGAAAPPSVSPARRRLRDEPSHETPAPAADPPGARPEASGVHNRRTSPRAVDVVVKIGGGLLASPDAFTAVLDLIDRSADSQRIVVVPGGGPFADAVRAVDARYPVPEDAAHWMAILAMDQYAHLIASCLERAGLVSAPGEIDAALAQGRVPVLAPFRWLRDADPLPHSWDVTSDSIAAWVAGTLGAERLVLVKPPSATGDLLDGYFSRACPAHVSAAAIPADRIAAIEKAMGRT